MITPLDILLRLNAPVETVSVTGKKEVFGAHKILITADKTIDEIDIDSGEMYVLPGGMPGTTNLEKTKKLTDALLRASERGAFLGAICAAPSVFGKLGLLKGKKATCYPGFEEFLEGAAYTKEAVAVDGNIITSRGAGTASEFGFALAKKLYGEEKVNALREAMQYE